MNDMGFSLWTMDQQLGLLAVVLTGVVFAAYMCWNYFVLKRRVHRVVEGDKALYNKHKGDKALRGELMNALSTVPQVIGEITGLAVATVLLATELQMGMVPGTFEYYVTTLALGLIAVSGISYMFSMEELMITLSPSISFKEKFELYAEAVTMKTVGFFCLWSTVLVLMLLTGNIWVISLACVYTLVTSYRHYEIRWMNG